MIRNKICVVIVTYNRLEKLKRALLCYVNQKYLPSCIVVVDNCSTDGTSAFLKGWCEENRQVFPYIVRSPKNLGGAGGFKLGIETALKMNMDWIWVSDDDAYPNIDALQIINDNINKKIYEDVVCFSGAVYDKSYDKIDFWHRRYNRKKIIYVPQLVPEVDYSNDSVCINETSFVGACFKTDILKKVGLPNSDLYLYYDDTEYSHRLNEYGRIVLIPRVKILHDTGAYSCTNSNVVSTWREYYLIRNHVYILKKYHWLTYIVYCALKMCKVMVLFASHKNWQTFKMHVVAITDGMREKIGLHFKYKPGFEIYR